MQLTEEQKRKANELLQQKITNGELQSQEDIDAWKSQYLEEVKPKPVQAQEGAPGQEDAIVDTASSSAPGSSDLQLKDDEEIGGWENLKNNVQNVYNRILGFDDRLALAAVDTFETLLGEEAAKSMYKAMPTYDSETGEWLDTPDEVREAAYRELAQTQAQNKQTVGLIDSWENGDAGQVVSAAAGAGLNMLSTLVTSGLTLGAGLYTDMVADAIADANETKAERMGISVQELYDRKENEFMLPASVGVAGGLLERMGVKGVNKYISSVASKNIGGALLAMANNSGKEGLTEWLQYGLETYNNEKAKGNDEAAQKALDNLFTREGAEMALQGAVGALVGGQAGKASKKAYKVVTSPEFQRGFQKGLNQAPADDLSEAQDTPEYAFNPKTSEKPYKSEIKANEEAQEELSGAEFYDKNLKPNQSDAQKDATARNLEKAKQTRETNRLVKDLGEEYEGTAQEINPIDKTAYILKGLEREANIKTVDEAADLSKSRQRDVMHLVTKASVGLRSAEETAKLDQAQENISEASKILENTTDPVQQEALQLYIDDEKDKVANTITNYNRKVLLASPTAVANAVESANELDRLSTQEQSIQENGQLPDAVKQSMIDNIRDRKAAAYEKGETARAEIEKSAAQNADLVDDNSKYLAQLLDEEIADNEKKTDAIVSEASDLGLVPDPDGDLVTDDSLSEGRQAISGENGVKEYGKTFGGNFGSRTEAIQAGIKLQQSAKTKGYKANVEYIDVNPERPGGDTQVVAEIYSPRQENVVESVNKLKNQQQAELEETDPAQAELDEAAEVVTQEGTKFDEAAGVNRKVATAEEKAQPIEDIASKYGYAPAGNNRYVVDSDNANIHAFTNSLKKRGHDISVDDATGIATVTPGGYEFSIDESGRAHDAEGKFVPKSQATEVARVKALPLEAEDGATFNLDGTVYEDGGLVVPIASKNMKASELTDEAIENFKTKYKDYMGPASKVGIYKFPGQDQVSIDLNVIAPSHMREEALKIGKSLGQESLFDLDTFENIKTGETGSNPKTPTANQARNIATDLSVEQDLRVPDARDLTQARRDARARAQSSQRQSRQATAEELAEIEAAREKRRNVIQEPGVPLKKRGEGEELTREAEPYFNKDAKTQQIEDLKGRITDESIDKLKEGNPNEALVASIPYVRILAKNNQRNRDAALDPEIESVALAAASEAFINGEFQGRQFAPENADDAIKFLGGIVKDAVRDYYLGPEGAAAGIPQIKKDASTRLNKINSAISRLGTRNPVEIAEALNKGFTSIQEKKLKGRIVPGTKEADRYRSPEQLGQELGPGRAKSRFIQDEKITPQQVNDLLARQEGLTPHRIDVTPFDKIADDVTEGLETGTGSIADVLGVNLETLPESNRDIAGKLNPKEVRAKLDDIINAVSKNPDTRKKIKRYVDREVLSQAQKARALKEFAAKLLNAERGLGKTTTPSQELDFSIEEGSATRNTDMGVRSKLQVNSHRQPWSQTAKELNRLLGSTNFNNDWVQWSPGQLGNLERGRAKGIPDHVLRELNKQPARVAKLASKYGASLRQDTNNPGVYHIYKPGKIGSKPDFSLTEKEAANTVADKDFINKMETMLNKAWPNHKVVTDPFAVQMKIGELQMNGIQAPWSKMKGFVVGNKVYLTGKAGYDTPIHEFAHVWAKQLMTENPKLWKRGVELLKGSEYARAVYNVPTYKEYLKGNPSKFWEEVMANAIGKRGAVLFQEKAKQNAWNKWMDSMTKWLKDKLGISSKKDYQNLTLDDWLNIGVHGTVSGGVPGAKSEFLQGSEVEYALGDRFDKFDDALDSNTTLADEGKDSIWERVQKSKDLFDTNQWKRLIDLAETENYTNLDKAVTDLTREANRFKKEAKSRKARKIATNKKPINPFKDESYRNVFDGLIRNLDAAGYPSRDRNDLYRQLHKDAKEISFNDLLDLSIALKNKMPIDQFKARLNGMIAGSIGSKKLKKQRDKLQVKAIETVEDAQRTVNRFGEEIGAAASLTGSVISEAVKNGLIAATVVGGLMMPLTFLETGFTHAFVTAPAIVGAAAGLYDARSKFAKIRDDNYSLIKRRDEALKRKQEARRKAKGIDFNLVEKTSADIGNMIEAKVGSKNFKKFNAKDVELAKKAGERAKWYKRPLAWTVTPAADDFHGLLQKFYRKGKEGEQDKKTLEKAIVNPFIKAHEKYTKESAELRRKAGRLISDAKAEFTDEKGVKVKGRLIGFRTNKQYPGTLGGQKINVAQALKGYVNLDGMGGEGSMVTDQEKAALKKFVESNPSLVKFIDGMKKMGSERDVNGKIIPNTGVLRETADPNSFLTGSVESDLVGFIEKDLKKRNFSDFNDTAGALFNPDVMSTITANFGEKYANALKNSLDRMGGKQVGGVADGITQKWNDWATKSVATIMFLNFRSAGLQLLSTVNYATAAKSPKELAYFVQGMFGLGGSGGFKKVWNSDFIKERRARAGYDVNLADLATSDKSQVNKFLNSGFYFTSLMDATAIGWGGGAYYNALKKANPNMSEEDIMRRVREQTEEAQQSSRPDRVSQHQTSGASKFILAFANTPAQYFRLTKKAIVDLKEGRGNAIQNLSKIATYALAQNLIFTALQSASSALIGGFGDEDDNEEELQQVNSMADSLLRGMGLYGAIASTIKNIAVEAFRQEQKPRPDHVATALKAVTISPPLSRKVNDLLAIGRGYQWDNPDKHVTAVAKGVSVATNLPTDWVQKKANATKALWDEEFTNFQKALIMLGWSEYQFKKKNGGSLDLDIDFNFEDLDLDDIDLDDLDIDI